MARLLFVPRILSCLTLSDRSDAKRCLHERDVELLRVILYSNIMLAAAAHRCNGPIIISVHNHDSVSVQVHGCVDAEGFAWDVVDLLEALPGIWYVRTEKRDGSVIVETVPLDKLYH